MNRLDDIIGDLSYMQNVVGKLGTQRQNYRQHLPRHGLKDEFP